MSDFKWYADDAESVVLQEQPMTAVYSNRQGQVVLRQKADGCYQDEDTLAYFNPNGALATAWAMIEQAHLIGLPQRSSSLMPLDDAGKPTELDHGLTSMVHRRPAPAANANPEEPSLLAAMNAAAE
jgi:hypothetical protein